MRAFDMFAVGLGSLPRSADLPRFFRGGSGTLRGLLCAVAIGLGVRPVVAATPSLLELTQNGKHYEGRLEAKGHDACWLMGATASCERSRSDSSKRSAPSTTISTSSRPPSCETISAAKCPSRSASREPDTS